MGADYMTAYVEIVGSEQEFIDSMTEFVKSCSDEMVMRIYDDLFCIDPDEDSQPIDILRYLLLSEVKDLAAIIDCARDVSMINIKGSDVLVTGGFSWGDSPTDSFDCISNCNLISWWMRKEKK